MTLPRQLYSSHFFYLAPIRGITDRLFRRIYHRHFPYFDGAVAPFINPQRFGPAGDTLLADVMPKDAEGLETIPQLLYNSAEEFIKAGRRLQELGYSHINWNLGCPAPQVANKRRGSGLLPYPGEITGLLDSILSELDAQISLKMRLGFKSPEDARHLLPLLENYALKEIIIHPRIGKQLYSGVADPEGFAECRRLTSHTLVYNGDIRTVQDFTHLARKFPETNRWMIGRGALADPFLTGEIRGICFKADEKKEKLQAFHDELYARLQEKLSGPGHLLSRMKQIWAYFIESFPENKKVLKKIRKATVMEHYEDAIGELFNKS